MPPSGGVVVLVLGVLALQAPSANTKLSSGTKCEWSPENNETSTRTLVSCRLSSTDGNISNLPVDGAAKLHLTCSDNYLFEEYLPVRAFHRLSKLEELQINDCHLAGVPQEAFDGLRSLKGLTLRTKAWPNEKSLELNSGSFDGLRQLQTLQLIEANLQAVPDSVFCPLENLHTLNLSSNGIRDVNSVGFPSRKPIDALTPAPLECSGAMDLRHLDLSKNEIQILPELSGITRLGRLQNLYLQDNQISELHPDSLSGLSGLRVLNISNNRLEVLPENLFLRVRDLREIHLQNNSLYQLGPGVFHKLEELLVLDLSHNQLSSAQIQGEVFFRLTRLIVLNLAHNSLTRIDASTFKDLVFLQNLDLRQNSISVIEDRAFHLLYNLHTLNIAENRLKHLSATIFEGLFILSKLTLNNNVIESIDTQTFKNCTGLKELDLSSNTLAEVPSAITELNFLRTLDLGENQITGFKNGSFRNLQQLTGLRLIDNNIGNLTAGMFWDLTGLQVLNLAKNKIQQIERGTFERCVQIEAIRLDGNFLSDVNGVFYTLKSLIWLNLSENHLVWFDYAFLPVNLKWLDIHGNFIEKLGDYYKMRDELHLVTLDASHNRITEINDLSFPNSVEVVFINNNVISSVQPHTFFDKVNLARVDMYANELVKLELNALRLSPVAANRSLPEFYLGGNPFDCNCSMDWLRMINNLTHMRQYPRVMDLDNVLCKLTYTRGATYNAVSTTKPSDFVCKYETHCFALCQCCEFDACDCKMICPSNCSCYHDQTWGTNIVDCSRQGNDMMTRRIPMDATHVYLDGNNFYELQDHIFIGRKNMRVLFLNSSKIQNIQNRTFNGLNALQILHLEENAITELKGFEFEQLNSLRELFLQNNQISQIANTTLSSLRALELLRLDGNRLLVLPMYQLAVLPQLREVALGGNQWSCKCKYLQEMQNWVLENRQRVIDTEDLWCYSNETKPPVKRAIDVNSTVCSDYYSGSSMIQNIIVSDYLPMVIVTLSVFLIVIFVLILMFIFRDPLRVWLYSTYGVRLFHFKTASAKHYGEDREKLYDGYVLYSPKDEEFVLQSIVAELEHGNPSFQLCLHYRDLPHHNSPYMQTSPVVVEAAEASRRVILVLSRNFLQTEWSRFEFRSALHEALKGRIFKLVLVEEGSNLPEAEMDPDLRPYLKTGARVKWGEKRFWERLRYVMPSAESQRKSCNYRRNINNYSIDSGVHRSHHHYDKNKPSLQQHINNHPLFKAAAVSNEPGSGPPAYSSESTLSRTPTKQEDPNYSSATTATPSPRPIHRYSDRPTSEHIYSSIDSPDYPTFERNGSRGPPPTHQTQPWRSGTSVIDTSGVQSYLV